jgi:hypothetical protein
MRIHRRNAPSLKTDANTPRLLRVLAAALVCQIWGCASGTIYNVGTDDGGSGGTGGQADASDTSGSNAKKDSATPDSYAGVCDPFSNNGCDSDKKCTALISNQAGQNVLLLACGDKKGDRGEGESCTQYSSAGTQTGDDCADGLACFAIGNGATCHRICPTSGTANACPSSSICSLRFDSMTALGLAFCQAPCQPLEKTGCQSDKACYATPAGAVCLTPGSAQPGETCTNPNDCAADSTCITGSTNVCSTFCSTATNGQPSCPSGKTCTPLPGTPPEPNAGYCK